jgi:hypothetical protein
MAWVGAEGAGSTVAPASVRRNARKKFKFEFLKFSTLGDQHIGQGFQ